MLAIVEFHRYIDADEEDVCADRPGATLNDRLREQFLAELGDAYGKYSLLVLRFAKDHHYYIMELEFDEKHSGIKNSLLIQPGDSLVQKFAIVIQECYDIHGMAGRYRILTAYDNNNELISQDDIKAAIAEENRRTLAKHEEENPGLCTVKKVPCKIKSHEGGIKIDFGMVVPKHNMTEHVLPFNGCDQFEHFMKRDNRTDKLRGSYWKELGIKTWFGGTNDLPHSIYLVKGECFEWKPIVEEILSEMARYFNCEFVNCTG